MIYKYKLTKALPYILEGFKKPLTMRDPREILRRAVTKISILKQFSPPGYNWRKLLVDSEGTSELLCVGQWSSPSSIWRPKSELIMKRNG